MRCPSCNKFPAKDTESEPEGDLEIDDEGMVTGDIRIVNNSECCGDELEEATFNVEMDFTSEVDAHLKAKHPAILAERHKPAPKVTKPTPIDPKSLDVFDRCKTCKRYWMLHYVRIGGKRFLVGHSAVKLKNARQADCVNGEGKFDPMPSKTKDSKEASFSLDVSLSRTDEMERKTRTGKAITNPRYMRRLYGIHVECIVTCDLCKEEIGKQEFADSVYASGMESLV